MHDVMERVQQLHVQRHVQEELNIYEHDEIHVIQYQYDIIRHDVIVHEINVQDR